MLEIINDTEEWNFFVSLRKIKQLKNSADYTKLNLKEISLLLLINTFTIENTNNYAEIGSIITKLDQLKNKSTSLNEKERFYFASIQLAHSTLTRLEVDQEIINECENYLSLIDINSMVDDGDETTIVMIFTYYFYYKAPNNVKMKKWDEAYNAIKMALDLSKLIAHDFLTFNAYNYLANYYIWKSAEFGKSLDVKSKQVNYFRSKKNYKYVNESLQHLSILYLERSNNLRKALEVSDQAISECSVINDNEEGNLTTIFGALNIKAIILAKMGKYAESLKIYDEVLPYASKKEIFDYGNSLVQWNINVGGIYQEMGKFDKSLEYLEIALTILAKSEYYYITLYSEVYYQFISVYLKLKKYHQAELFLEKFTDIIDNLRKDKDIDNNNFLGYIRDLHAHFDIAKAMMLIVKKTMIGNSQAQILLENVIADSFTKKELLINALILLIDLEIQEYRLFEKDEVIEKINSNTEQLRSITEGFNSIPLKIQVLILQAKLDVISGNLTKYENIMNTAKQYAVDYNLTEQEEMINAELVNFNKEIRKWENIISTPVKNRLINIELEDYIKKMSQIVKE